MTTCRHKNHINNVYSSDRNIHLGIRHGILCSIVRQAIHPALGSRDPCLERLTSLPSFFLWDSAHADEGKEVAKTDDEEKEESGGAEEEEEEEEPEDVSIHFQAISFNAGTTTISLPVGDISNHILSYHLPPSLDLIQKLQCHTNPSSLRPLTQTFYLHSSPQRSARNAKNPQPVNLPSSISNIVPRRSRVVKDGMEVSYIDIGLKRCIEVRFGF